MASELPSEPENIEILHAAVEAFRKREITYREILEDLPAAIYTTDAEGRITYYNQACVELSGRRPALGHDRWCVSWKLFKGAGEPLSQTDYPTTLAIRQRQPVRGVELMAERPDGSRLDLMCHATPIVDAVGEILGIVTMLVDVTEQRLAQERAMLLATEVDHRSTNLLTLVQSLVRLTREDTLEAYREALEGRLTALAKANRLVAEARWTNVTLRSLIEVELGAFPERQVKVSGEHIELSPQSAQYLGMLIHELCTNAVKYGALSIENGFVSLDWAVDDNGILMIQWQEHGGPRVTEPVHKNIGNAIIIGAVRQLKGEVFREWHGDGLRCTFLCSVDRL